MDSPGGESAHRPHGDAGPDAALPWIDWIRFLAALQVFLFHLRLYIFKPYDQFAPAHKSLAVIAWFGVTHFGGEAVLLFFALSGYLVGGGLIERVRAGRFRPGAYAIDRATRLLVPFVPAMAAAVALQMLRHEPVEPSVILGNLASLQGVLVPVQPYLGVDWSLAYEFWFYVLGGAIAACLLVARWRPFAVGVGVLAFLIFSVLDRDLLFCWMLGAMVSQVTLARVRPLAMLAGLALVAVGLFLLNELFAGARAHLLHGMAADLSLGRILLTLGVLIVLRNLVVLVPRRARTQRIDALGTRLAAFSYSLYLIHIPILTLLAYLGAPSRQDLTPAALAQYVGSVVLIPVAAYGFYWLFERHTDAIRSALKRRLLRG